MSENDSKVKRAQHLEKWCAQQAILSGQTFDFVMVSGDASFRRYFRVLTSEKTYIAVDAPPDKENSPEFCKVAELFRKQGCKVPVVYAYDFDAGFMLLSDLGDRLLLSEINEKNADIYYQEALSELIKLQSASLNGDELPLYDQGKLIEEMSLFQEWFLKAYLDYTPKKSESDLIIKTERFIAETVGQQQQVMVHRDFHSRNIMLQDDGLAMIDFQDALLGPITYDAVSLLKDCYIEWSEEKREAWLKQYFEKLIANDISTEKDFEKFYYGFELMGLQRHLKVLGIFSRLSIRDGKDGYLNDLPLTFKYVEQVLNKEAMLGGFAQFFLKEVKPLFIHKQAERKKVLS